MTSIKTKTDPRKARPKRPARLDAHGKHLCPVCGKTVRESNGKVRDIHALCSVQRGEWEPPQVPDKDKFSVIEVAAITGFTRGMVTKHIRAGNLKATRFGARAYEVTRLDLVEFLSHPRLTGKAGQQLAAARRVEQAEQEAARKPRKKTSKKK